MICFHKTGRGIIPMKGLIRTAAAAFAVFLLLTAAACGGTQQKETTENSSPADGIYRAAVTLTGGSGRATVESPARITVKEGKVTATLVWSSANYDYMLVNGDRYEPEILDGHSVFEIPVALDCDLTVTADTVAMSTPHEIEYILHFESAGLKPETEAAR